MILAAIDLGSNAIRLLLAHIEVEDKSPRFRKLNLVRVPLRLGMEVFNVGSISPAKEKDLIDTLKAYKYLMKVYKVEGYEAYASSAMRDATNGKEIVEKIRKQTDIDMKIISGTEEAKLLVLNQQHIKEDSLFIDVGGGSTEITVQVDGKIEAQSSFNLGTLRILHSNDTLKEWNRLEAYVQQFRGQKLQVVGTGGNINKTFSLLKVSEGKPIETAKLQKFYQGLAKLSVTERMEKYKLREDRADVIVPALSIYLFVMENLQASSIYVPKLGLADAIVKDMYYKIAKAKK